MANRPTSPPPLVPAPVPPPEPLRRTSERQNQTQMDALVRRKEERTRDPALQERVRHQIATGRFSDEESRRELEQQRRDARSRKKKRPIGTNARTLGEQACAQVIKSRKTLEKAFSKTVDTAHYPALTQCQPGQDFVLMSLRTIEHSWKGNKEACA